MDNDCMNSASCRANLGAPCRGVDLTKRYMELIYVEGSAFVDICSTATVIIIVSSCTGPVRELLRLEIHFSQQSIT